MNVFKFHRNITESPTIFIPTYYKTVPTYYWNFPTCGCKRHELNLIFITKLLGTLIVGILIIRTHELRRMRKQNLLDTYFLYTNLSILAYHEDLVGSHFLLTRGESCFTIGWSSSRMTATSSWYRKLSCYKTADRWYIHGTFLRLKCCEN
jgi:hypothetical protein